MIITCVGQVAVSFSTKRPDKEIAVAVAYLLCMLGLFIAAKHIHKVPQVDFVEKQRAVERVGF